METVDKLQEERLVNYNKILSEMREIKSMNVPRGVAKGVAILVYEGKDGKTYQVVLSHAQEFILYYTYRLFTGMKSSIQENEEE